MTPDLFRLVLEGRGTTPDSRYSALPVSIFAHAVLLTTIIVIALMASEVMPVVRSNDYLVMPAVAAPRLPSIPTPAAQAPAPRRAAAIAQAAATGVAPISAPSGIGRERMIQVEPVPSPAAPTDVVGDVAGTGVAGGTGIVDVEPPAPVRPPEPVRASRLPKPPMKIKDVRPVYPAIAQVGRIQGIVVIEAVIGVTGEVTDAKVLRGKPLLDDAALAAVRQWRYTPTLLAGVPTAVILVVTVNFSMT